MFIQSTQKSVNRALNALIIILPNEYVKNVLAQVASHKS